MSVRGYCKQKSWSRIRTTHYEKVPQKASKDIKSPFQDLEDTSEKLFRKLKRHHFFLATSRRVAYFSADLRSEPGRERVIAVVCGTLPFRIIHSCSLSASVFWDNVGFCGTDPFRGGALGVSERSAGSNLFFPCGTSLFRTSPSRTLAERGQSANCPDANSVFELCGGNPFRRMTPRWFRRIAPRLAERRSPAASTLTCGRTEAGPQTAM